MLTVTIQQEKKSCDCRLNEMKFGLWVPWGPESSCLTWCKWDGPLSWVIKMEKWCSGFFTGEMWSEFPFRWPNLQRALHKEVAQWPRVLMALCKPSGRCQPHPANCKICFSTNENKGKKPRANRDDRQGCFHTRKKSNMLFITAVAGGAPEV